MSRRRCARVRRISRRRSRDRRGAPGRHALVRRSPAHEGEVWATVRTWPRPPADATRGSRSSTMPPQYRTAFVSPSGPPAPARGGPLGVAGRPRSWPATGRRSSSTHAGARTSSGCPARPRRSRPGDRGGRRPDVVVVMPCGYDARAAPCRGGDVPRPPRLAGGGQVVPSRPRPTSRAGAPAG